jgi:hypothetical protein
METWFCLASSITIFPPITRDSLLARAMAFLVLIAERVGMKRPNFCSLLNKYHISADHIKQKSQDKDSTE